MIDIEDYEHMPAVMAGLKQQLGIILQTETSGRAMLHKINTILIDLRARLRSQNVYFPAMTAIILPSIQTFELVRCDLERGAIRQTILNIIVKYPSVDMMEVASAVKLAFPDYKPEA